MACVNEYIMVGTYCLYFFLISKMTRKSICTENHLDKFSMSNVCKMNNSYFKYKIPNSKIAYTLAREDYYFWLNNLHLHDKVFTRYRAYEHSVYTMQL